ATSHPDTAIDEDISINEDAAGHCYTNQQDAGTETEPSDSTQQDDLMTTAAKNVYKQRPPFEMLTDDDDLNPNSWAANNLFQLYAQVDAAVRRWVDDVDRYERQQLTADVFSNVAQVIADVVTDWTKTNAAPQDAAFTQLNHNASTYLHHTAVNPNSWDDVNDWLDALDDDLRQAIGTVLDGFNYLVPVIDDSQA